MKPLALAALVILVVVALRHREPDRAVAPLHRRTLWLVCSACGRKVRHGEFDAHIAGFHLFDADLQPSDPYPASLLP